MGSLKGPPKGPLISVQKIQILVGVGLFLPLLSSCLESESEKCSSGLICPRGLVCAPNGNSCVMSSQIADCREKQNGADCSTDEIGAGVCFAGVCVQKAACGNGAIETGETCDDMNLDDLDGCRDCQLAEFALFAKTTDGLGPPAVAAFDDGSFVVVYQRESTIYLRLFDAQAFAVDSEVEVGGAVVEPPDFFGRCPKVETDHNGNVLVVWPNNRQDSMDTRILGRVFTRDGLPLGSGFGVSGKEAGTEAGPQVTSRMEGGFVVTMSANDSVTGWDVYARELDSNGAPTSDLLPLAAQPSGDEIDPVIAELPNGSYVVTWVGSGANAQQYDIYRRTIDPDESEWEPESVVNAYRQNNQTSPALAVYGNGQFVIAWVSEDINDENLLVAKIHAQPFNAAGQHSGEAFLVDDTTRGDQGAPSVSGDETGFTIVWQSGAIDGVVGRRFSLDANPLGETNALHHQLDGYTFQAPAIASLAETELLAVWYAMNIEQDVHWQRHFGQRMTTAFVPLGHTP